MKFGKIPIVLTIVIFLVLSSGCASREPAKPAYKKRGPTSQELAAKIGLEGNYEAEYKKYGQVTGPYKLDELEVTKLNSRPVSLKGYQGHWVLMDFFTTYSVPSQTNMPILNEIYQRYKDKGLIVAGVSMDMQGKVLVEPFLDELGVEYPVYLADGETKNGKTPYGYITEIPVILLINPKGGMERGFMGLVKKEELESAIRKKL